ncbi:MAG: hypothetical protein Q9187_005469 [Circinaria calcarea]
MATNLDVDFYDSLGIRYEEAFGHDVGLQRFIQEALDMLPPTATVLDIGCGTGKPTSAMVTASGRRLHGIDFSPVMIELSRKQVPLGSFQQVNMLEYTPREPFDAAFTIFSIFPLSREEIITVAAKWAEWIVPGGFLFIGTIAADDVPTEPSMFDADGQCARGVESRFMGKITEVVLYTRHGWKTLLEQVGFEIVRATMTLFEPPAEAQCEPEAHYYIAARKVSSA